MRLLVSVRSAVEAAAAVNGGACIIDAKEPLRGSLGRVSPPVLREIADRVPGEIPLSVALGDLGSVAEVRDVLSELDLEPRPGGTLLKVGLLQGSSGHMIVDLLAEAVGVGESLRCRPRLIAVAYADHARAGLPPPDTVARHAIASGCRGVLLDTAVKDGQGLLSWIAPAGLGSWVARLRRAGLLTALAGSLDKHSFASVLAAHPDVIGVRGAACSGGRNGIVETSQVHALAAMLTDPGLAKRHAWPSMDPVA
jgi:(5-formylfuran-3-yl)methyl phosphate synthase